MAVDITKPLRSALGRLETEKQRLEHQIAAIHGILGGTNRGRTRGDEGLLGEAACRHHETQWPGKGPVGLLVNGRHRFTDDEPVNRLFELADIPWP